MSILATVGTALQLIKKASDKFSLYMKRKKEKRLREYNKAVSRGDVSNVKRHLRKWL